MDKNFIHLHVHTYYSFLDGYSSPSDLAKEAKRHGMESIAITDHNHLGGTIEFQKACRKEKIKPILGLESYYTEDTSIITLDDKERKKLAQEAAIKDGVEIPKKVPKKEINKIIKPYEYDTKQYHILFLAMNQKGWTNLIKLQSEASAKGTFNGRYICDNKMIEQYSEGLIMTTACIGNPLSKFILNNQEKHAEELLLKWKDIFHDRLYLEIQPLNIEKQWRMNEFLIRMHKKHGIKIISTNDVHYAKKEDHDDHDTLLCIGIGKKKEDAGRMRYSNDFWLKSYEEMIECYEEQSGNIDIDSEEYMDIIKESLKETINIKARIEEIQIEADNYQLPDLTFHRTLDTEGFLTLECYQSLYKYKEKKPGIHLKTYEKRLRHELKIINRKGFASYILVVQDYIKNSGCPTGPGRGSGGGSLVLFLLGITKVIDPIEHGLLFSRFMTMDRTALPDCA